MLRALPEQSSPSEQRDLRRLVASVDPTNFVLVLSIVVPLIALGVVCWIFWQHRHDD
jgi:hypothetical protein